MLVELVKERPILFSGPMVRAIRRVENPKTQTRRVIKLPSWSTKNWDDFETDGKEAQVICANTGCLASIPCPYGKPGDRLWVRETWYQGVEKLWYKADIEELSQCGISGWKPSIHMPRRASRIILEVVKVRVERLQDISEEDCKAEGIAVYAGEQLTDPSESKLDRAIYRDGFIRLWDSINGKTHPWESNPWLRVVEFRRIESAQGGAQ